MIQGGEGGGVEFFTKVPDVMQCLVETLGESGRKVTALAHYFQLGESFKFQVNGSEYRFAEDCLFHPSLLSCTHLTLLVS